ncbi:hypothetical protein ARZXY2_2533 [Arthrobacter sp. ZXY-2]|nr:hypothetical protein ARZXY2_2533 [Arthrobacter sp. ZXY-2]
MTATNIPALLEPIQELVLHQESVVRLAGSDAYDTQPLDAMTRLLAAAKAVDSILSQALTMISVDPDVSEYERGFDDSTRGLSAKLRSAVEAALRGEA